MSGRLAAVLTAVLAVLSVVVVSGCANSVGRLSFANPPATTAAQPAPPETLPGDLDATVEEPVYGVTTTTLPAIGPGTASLYGTVTDPTGQPVAGATVGIERIVGDTFASATTKAAGDGSFSFRDILGGAYDVRAWLAPDLDMPTPDQLFLADGQTQTISLQETTYQSQAVQVAINPAQPVVDQPAALVVQVTDPQVSADGVLTEPPSPGAVVTLVNGSDWQVQNGNPLTTNAAGQATFDVECTVTGSDPLSAQVASAAPINLQMPVCTAPAPATTTTTTSPYDFYPTTTCPPSDQPATTLDFGSSC